jgi:Kef-type K+ transport system membrane component KefB
MVGLVIVTGRYLVPRLLDRLARQNNREAFFLAAMAAVFAAAWAMDRAGMSMALGAFLMGMMLSTSRYSLQIEATLEPHKGLLMSLFFVAVGMSVDVAALAQRPFQFALHVLASSASRWRCSMPLPGIFGTKAAARRGASPSCSPRAASSGSSSSAPPRRSASSTTCHLRDGRRGHLADHAAHARCWSGSATGWQRRCR